MPALKLRTGMPYVVASGYAPNWVYHDKLSVHKDDEELIVVYAIPRRVSAKVEPCFAAELWKGLQRFV